MARREYSVRALSVFFGALECATLARSLIFGIGMSATKKQIEKTADGHYVVIDGRKWRATNPNLSEEERQRLVHELMSARREVGRALKAKDTAAERAARDRVQSAKVALGERGPKWWETNTDTETEIK